MYTLEQRMLKIYPSVVPNWVLGGPKRAQEGPKWSRNRPPGGPNEPRSTQNGHEETSMGSQAGTEAAKMQSKSGQVRPQGPGANFGAILGCPKGPQKEANLGP